MQAFAAPIALGASTVLPSAVTRTSPLRAPPAPAASTVSMISTSALDSADAYMSRTVRAEYKRFAAASGTYTVQCAEAAVHGGAYDLAVRARNAAFKKRQASASAAYADLFATRRAAIVLAHGCHTEEAKLVAYPSAAAACVFGKSEAMRACNRYSGAGGMGTVDSYMAECVTRQYKAMKVPDGVYTSACSDGSVAGEAEDSRVAAKMVEFKAGQFGAGAKAQARYNASLQAIALSRGCDYEDVQYSLYPTMAGSMRWSSGAYAAKKAGAAQGVSGGGGAKSEALAVRLAGVNAETLWPSSLIRPAIKRKTAPWVESTLKQYRGMSPAALEYGIAAQTGAFEGGGPAEAWTPGWQPTPVSTKNYGG